VRSNKRRGNLRIVKYQRLPHLTIVRLAKTKHQGDDKICVYLEENVNACVCEMRVFFSLNWVFVYN